MFRKRRSGEWARICLQNFVVTWCDCQVQTDQIGQLGQGRIINFFVKPALPDPEAEIKNDKMGLSQRLQTGNCCGRS